MVKNQSLGRGSVTRVEDARSSPVHVAKSFRVSRNGLTLISAVRRSSLALAS